MKKKRNLKKLWLLVLVLPLLAMTACGGDNGSGSSASAINPITVAEIREAQTAWGEGLVAISTAFANGYNYVDIAVAVLENLYGYAYGPVLFKPTIAAAVPFRFDWDGAASYFIGTSAPNTIAEDAAGFATNVWTAVSFEDDWTFVITGESAIGMGTVVITDGDGNPVTVQKSMAWFRGSDGNLRLKLHHSSVPFS